MSMQAGGRGEAQKPPQKPPQGGNGAAAKSPAQSAAQSPGKSPGKSPGVRPREARQARFAQAFAQVVAVLMRDPGFRSMPLADLEWLVLPAVMSGQLRVAQAPAASLARRQAAEAGKGGAKEPGNKEPGNREPGKAGGVLVPVAAVLWARVSDEIDRALSSRLDQPVRLKPHQWASGEHVWLVAVAGDRRAVPRLIDRLAKAELKGQRIKMRVRGPDNTVVVKTLAEA